MINVTTNQIYGTESPPEHVQIIEETIFYIATLCEGQTSSSNVQSLLSDVNAPQTSQSCVALYL